MRQLELFAAIAENGTHLALRVNPGLGAGHNNRNMTGGANSSFGLWNSYVPEALTYAKQHGLIIDRLHVHAGSGADPKVWEHFVIAALEIAETMPDVKILDIGGGFKIHRYADEHEADMQAITRVFAGALNEFAERTSRKLHLEIEPGTWLVGHTGVLLAEIVDIVDTGDDGHQFLRLNTGMNDFIRPTMYGSQHRIAVLNDSQETSEYVVVGHNCETGDILTPAPGDPEGIEPRHMHSATIGDYLAIYDVGAYCNGFAATGYNSYPSAQKLII
jgi:diaminopimelate decarboxylase